jgi:hypothetical protein
MCIRWSFLGCFALVVVGLALPLVAVSADRGVQLKEESVSRWRFGVTVKAVGGALSGVRATLPVPMDWPEQTVKKITEDKTANIGSIRYETLDAAPKQPGVRQMVVSIPRLAAGEQATALITLEVTKRRIDAPDETDVYRIPKPGAVPAKFLAPSPYIESNDAKVKSLAAELIGGKEQAWDQAAAIFDWVRANIKYEFAEEIKPAVASIKAGKGDCEELSSLVIAMCRASKIPARAVWIPAHTYPEFYLVDEQGKGHWFPCQAAGADREFGSMKEDRPIIQKGDNFTVAGEKAPQRYVKQSLSIKDAAATPEYKFIMERVKD